MLNDEIGFPTSDFRRESSPKPVFFQIIHQGPISEPEGVFLELGLIQFPAAVAFARQLECSMGPQCSMSAQWVSAQCAQCVLNGSDRVLLFGKLLGLVDGCATKLGLTPFDPF